MLSLPQGQLPKLLTSTSGWELLWPDLKQPNVNHPCHKRLVLLWRLKMLKAGELVCPCAGNKRFLAVCVESWGGCY